MNTKINIGAGAFLALILFSCSPKIPFTQSVREQHSLTESDLKSLQFFNSHDIVLNWAESNAKEQNMVDGTLTIKSGKSVEQVIIKAGTPGIAERVPGTKSIAVSFEFGENTGLIFGTSKTSYNDRYTLMAPAWKENKGKIQYAGKTYYTSGRSGDTYLQFKMKRLNKIIRKQRVVKGRKI